MIDLATALSTDFYFIKPEFICGEKWHTICDCDGRPVARVRGYEVAQHTISQYGLIPMAAH